MKARNAILFTIIVIVIFWFVIPAIDCWSLGRNSMVRFDPRVSKDYNCIYIEGHSRKSFTIPWLSRHTSLDYMRIRYTPNAENQPYGIMFVDPQTLAFQAYSYCASRPAKLSNNLNSPQFILDWIRSQPNSTRSASHTNDANEIYAAIGALAHTDLEHFYLPSDFYLHNFLIKFSSLPNDTKPNWLVFFVLVIIWLPVIPRMKKNSNHPTTTKSAKLCLLP